jgi:hypothetical protein
MLHDAYTPHWHNTERPTPAPATLLARLHTEHVNLGWCVATITTNLNRLADTSEASALPPMPLANPVGTTLLRHARELIEIGATPEAVACLIAIYDDVAGALRALAAAAENRECTSGARHELQAEWSRACDGCLTALYETIALQLVFAREDGSVRSSNDAELLMVLAAARDGLYPSPAEAAAGSFAWAERRDCHRFPTSIAATLRANAEAHAIEIRDISELGMRIAGTAADFALTPETVVEIHLGPTHVLSGTVAWVDESGAGLRLTTAISDVEGLIATYDGSRQAEAV